MKLRVLLVCVWFFSLITEAQEVPLTENVAESLHRAYLLLQQLNITEPQLDFSPVWRNWRDRKFNDNQVTLEKLQLLISRLSKQQKLLTVCQQQLVAHLTFQLSLLHERNRLIEALPFGAPEYSYSFYQLPNGRAWYQHWLKSWLLSDVSIDELQAVAIKELRVVTQARKAFNKASLRENLHHYSNLDKEKIIRAFKHREKVVYKHMNKFIAGGFKASAVHIEESNFPKNFPAPGLYNAANQTFLYHLQTERLPEAHMDWLFLHEAVPGHHFQSQFEQHKSVCPNNRVDPLSTVFSEGWAAYVEQFGTDLGLFTDISSGVYALDWQALRAVRVLLDIGIHFYGWTDEQAEKEWMKHIPEQRAIMAREISRIRRWPVQVITYVYGKARIQQKVAQLKILQPELSIAEIHRDILRLSSYLFFDA